MNTRMVSVTKRYIPWCHGSTVAKERSQTLSTLSTFLNVLIYIICFKPENALTTFSWDLLSFPYAVIVPLFLHSENSGFLKHNNIYLLTQFYNKYNVR